MQDDLGLVKLLLDLGDAARLVGVLILDDILLQLWERHLVILGLPLYRGQGFLGKELVHQLRKDTVGRNVWVVLGDDDAGDALRPSIAVYHVIWATRLEKGTLRGRCNRRRTLLRDTLPLSRPSPFRHRLTDHGHEVGIFVPGEPREIAKLVLAA